MATRIIKTAHLVSSDPTISVPDEVQERRDGRWIAVHAGEGDYLYDTLAALEAHYGVVVPSAVARREPVRGDRSSGQVTM